VQTGQVRRQINASLTEKKSLLSTSPGGRKGVLYLTTLYTAEFIQLQ
jgi:hypothetical protein